MLACLLASLATPALAQPAADLATPEALAAFVMEACVYETPTPEVSEDAIQAAGFALAERGEETVEFAAPDGSTLALGARDETFASCELRLPDRSEAFFEALAQAMSAAIGERYPVADLESLEDGMMWRLEPAPELLTETELSHLENGDVLVVSATEVGRVPLGLRVSPRRRGVGAQHARPGRGRWVAPTLRPRPPTAP